MEVYGWLVRLPTLDQWSRCCRILAKDFDFGLIVGSA